MSSVPLENLGKNAFTIRFRDHSICGDCIPDIFVPVQSFRIWSKTQEEAKAIFEKEYPRCSIESVFEDINMTTYQRKLEQYEVAAPEKPITGLPVWAQKYIREMERKKEEAVAELNTLRARVENGGFPEASCFDDGVIIADSTSSTRYRKVSGARRVYFNDPETGIKVQLLADGEVVRVYTERGPHDDAVVIASQAANCFNLVGVNWSKK